MKFQRLPLCSHWCLSTQLLSVSIQFSGVLIFVEKSCVEFKYGFTWISWLPSTYFHSQLNLEHKVIKEGGTDYSIWRLERLLILPSAYSRLLSPSILTTNDEFHLSLRIIIRSIRWASKKTTSSRQWHQFLNCCDGDNLVCRKFLGLKFSGFRNSNTTTAMPPPDSVSFVVKSQSNERL